MRKVVAVLGVLIVLGIGGFVVFRPSTPPTAAPMTPPSERRFPVNTTAVRVQPLQETSSFHGTLAPNSRVHVVPRVGGRVAEVLVQVGQEVTEGDVLVQLETDELTLQTRQAAAGLQIAQANLNRILTGAREEEIKQAEAALEQARANFANAEQTFTRAERLSDEGVMSGREFDAAKTQYEVAQAQFLSAQKTLEMITQGARAEDIASAQASVAQAEAQYELSQLTLGNASIKSPISGVVSQVSTERGALVGSTSPVVSVVDISSIKMNLQASERDVVRLRPGQTVETVVNVLPGMSFTGKITTVSPVSEGGGLFPISVEIPNEEGLLKAGLYGTATVVLAEREDVLVVPPRSVVTSRGESGVYRVDEGVAKFVPVEFGVRSQTAVEVVSGLAIGDEVVEIGTEFLRDGALVVVVGRGDDQ